MKISLSHKVIPKNKCSLLGAKKHLTQHESNLLWLWIKFKFPFPNSCNTALLASHKCKIKWPKIVWLDSRSSSLSELIQASEHLLLLLRNIKLIPCHHHELWARLIIGPSTWRSVATLKTSSPPQSSLGSRTFLRLFKQSYKIYNRFMSLLDSRKVLSTKDRLRKRSEKCAAL